MAGSINMVPVHDRLALPPQSHERDARVLFTGHAGARAVFLRMLAREDMSSPDEEREIRKQIEVHCKHVRQVWFAIRHRERMKGRVQVNIIIASGMGLWMVCGDLSARRAVLPDAPAEALPFLSALRPDLAIKGHHKGHYMPHRLSRQLHKPGKRPIPWRSFPIADLSHYCHRPVENEQQSPLSREQAKHVLFMSRQERPRQGVHGPDRHRHDHDGGEGER